MTEAETHATLRRPGKLRKTALAVALLAGTALGGFTAGHLAFAANDTMPTAGAAVNAGVTAPAGIPDFADLVARVKPAVVSITTKLEIHQTADEDAGPSSP